MPRTIFHLEVPDFAVAVERLRHPSLRERPVLIAPPGGPRSLVLVVSAEARGEGVVRGMRIGAAQRLCPRAVVLPPDRVLYRRAGSAVGDLLGRFTPVVEGGEEGRFFLDMTGTRRLHGPSRDAAARLLREIGSRLRLPAAVGIAINKSVSEVASSLIRRDLLDILPGDERPFLAPWEVKKLPGTDEVPDPRLFEELNITRIGQLAGYPATHLAAAFGGFGTILRQRARGIDPRPVLPVRRQPELRQEEILATETNERERLAAAVRRLAQRGGWDLRRRGSVAATLALQIGYVDDYAVEGRLRLPCPAQDEGPLIAAATALLDRLLTRRVRVRYLGLVLADLHPAARQLRLFEAEGAAAPQAKPGPRAAPAPKRGAGDVEGAVDRQVREVSRLTPPGPDAPLVSRLTNQDIDSPACGGQFDLPGRPAAPNLGAASSPPPGEPALTGALDQIRARFGIEAIQRGAA